MPKHLRAHQGIPQKAPISTKSLHTKPTQGHAKQGKGTCHHPHPAECSADEVLAWKVVEGRVRRRLTHPFTGINEKHSSISFKKKTRQQRKWERRFSCPHPSHSRIRHVGNTGAGKQMQGYTTPCAGGCIKWPEGIYHLSSIMLCAGAFSLIFFHLINF